MSEVFVYAEIILNGVVTNCIGGVYVVHANDWNEIFNNTIDNIAEKYGVHRKTICIKTFTPLPNISEPTNKEMYLYDEE